MIIITGKDRDQILDTYAIKRDIQNPSGLHTQKAKTVDHDYTHKFTCNPAKITDNAVTLITYHEFNDVKVLKMSAAINNLEITVRII